jgi:hypothetical protein
MFANPFQQVIAADSIAAEVVRATRCRSMQPICKQAGNRSRITARFDRYLSTPGLARTTVNPKRPCDALHVLIGGKYSESLPISPQQEAV